MTDDDKSDKSTEPKEGEKFPKREHEPQFPRKSKTDERLPLSDRPPSDEQDQ